MTSVKMRLHRIVLVGVPHLAEGSARDAVPCCLGCTGVGLGITNAAGQSEPGLCGQGGDADSVALLIVMSWDCVRVLRGAALGWAAGEGIARVASATG